MPGPGSQHTTIMAERRRQAAQLYLQGIFQPEIARRLGVTQACISLDLKAVRKAWQAAAIQDMDVLIGEELARLALVEQEAWTAWEASKRPKEVTLMEGSTGEPAARKAKVRKEAREGNPQFLERIDKCIERRCTLLGLNPPAKIAPTTPDGQESWQPQVLWLPSKAPSVEE
jgi:hypothetical protein